MGKCPTHGGSLNPRPLSWVRTVPQGGNVHRPLNQRFTQKISRSFAPKFLSKITQKLPKNPFFSFFFLWAGPRIALFGFCSDVWRGPSFDQEWGSGPPLPFYQTLPFRFKSHRGVFFCGCFSFFCIFAENWQRWCCVWGVLPGAQGSWIALDERRPPPRYAHRGPVRSSCPPWQPSSKRCGGRPSPTTGRAYCRRATLSFPMCEAVRAVPCDVCCIRRIFSSLSVYAQVLNLLASPEQICKAVCPLLHLSRLVSTWKSAVGICACTVLPNSGNGITRPPATQWRLESLLDCTVLNLNFNKFNLIILINK